MAYAIEVRSSNDDWYDFDSAVSDANDYLVLYNTGCQMPDGGWNCTAACLDTDLGPYMVWNSTFSTYTLHNCMVFPYIAYLLATGNLTAQAENVSKTYQIPPDANLAYSGKLGWPVINNCIENFCSTKGTPGCDQNPSMRMNYTYYPNEKYHDQYDNYHVNVTFPSGFNSGLCYHLDAAVNPDIGGIGMFVSYLMQTFIIFSAWLGFRFFETWAEPPKTQTLVLSRGGRRASILKHQRDTLVDALGDFQAAQVFFMLAVQVASIIAINNPDSVQASSWQQLWNNIGILWDLAMGGCLPVVFATLLLRVGGQRDIFPLITSTCCVYLSAAVWFYNSYAAVSPNNIAYDGEPLSSCGGPVSPTKFCYSFDWWAVNADASTQKGTPMVVFCLVVQACLVLDQCPFFSDIDECTQAKTKVDIFTKIKHSILRHPAWNAYERAATARSLRARLRLDTAEQVLNTVRGCIILTTECLLAALNVILITDYAHMLQHMKNDPVTLNLEEWSLGQVISVTIWIPVLLKYIWQATMGNATDNKVQSCKPAHDAGGLGVTSTGVELTPLEPAGRGAAGRIRYERLNSNA